MLDIVISHCDEPWYICRKQFQMLDMQRVVNWNEIRVIVVNDGGLHVSEEELKQLTFPVEQIDIPKRGVSAARNAGMDYGTEPWIMFCDCDDCFTHIYALDEILTAVRRHANSDMVWTQCMTEFGRIVVPIAGHRKMVFIHGKVYRRAFLEENGIRFDENVHYGEDTLFNDVVTAKTERIAQAPCRWEPYVWIRRGGSVTTRGKKAEDEA